MLCCTYSVRERSLYSHVSEALLTPTVVYQSVGAMGMQLAVGFSHEFEHSVGVPEGLAPFAEKQYWIFLCILKLWKGQKLVIKQQLLSYSAV